MLAKEEHTEGGWGQIIGVAVFGVLLVSAAAKWPNIVSTTGLAAHLPFKGNDENALPLHPLLELLKLVVACLIGIVVTDVHRRYHRDKPLPRSLQQAQVLLCVAGAMVMVISATRWRARSESPGPPGSSASTPVEDPKDTTLLFLLVGLGMACGVGLLEVAGLGTAFLCLVLVVLDRFGEMKSRTLLLSLVASGSEFPTEHVCRILNNSVDAYEARELVQGSEAVVKYSVVLAPSTPISWISQELMANGKAGLKAVSWSEQIKKAG